MSIERYLLLNLAADFALVAAASRALGCFRWRRALAASAIGAACAVPAAMHPNPLAGIAAQLGMLGLLSAIIAGDCGPRVASKAAALLAGGALLSAGVSLLPLFSPRGAAAVPCAPAGAALLGLMLRARHPLRVDWQVGLALEAGGQTARFRALIDTGNRLREPLSGLPVLIAEESLLAGALPVDGWREITYGAVGGGGAMRCFKPRALWIERGRHRTRAPNVWVALSPGPLPGSARALAPAEFSGFL